MIFIKQIIFIKSVNYLFKWQSSEAAPLIRIPNSP